MSGRRAFPLIPLIENTPEKVIILGVIIIIQGKEKNKTKQI